MAQVPQALHEAFLRLFDQSIECDVELDYDGYVLRSWISHECLELEFEGASYTLWLWYNGGIHGFDSLELERNISQYEYDELELSDKQIEQFNDLVLAKKEAVERDTYRDMRSYNEEYRHPYTVYL